MNITLLGATGAVGGHFLNKALAAGHEVTALVRDPSKLEPRPGLAISQGDATNAKDLQGIIAGTEIVASCLGNVKGPQGWRDGNFIMAKAAEAILSAAVAQAAPPRCMFISTIGCGGSSWVVKQLLSMIVGKASMADYEKADARIARESTVPYLLVRPAALKEKPGNGKFRVFKGDGTFARPMAKEDVAEFLLAAVSSNEWDGGGGVQLAGRK